MDRKSLILQAMGEMPWAILPGSLAVLVEIASRHAAGEKLTAEEVEQRISAASAARRTAERSAGSVAVLPLFGPIFPRANMMTDVSGATSAERFGKEFGALLKNPDVSAIVIDVDSPGGAVGGIEELSAQIYAARGKKPITAVANHLAASAAYWIATAADELVVSPSGEVGSIGVLAVHEEHSAELERLGVKMTLISEGKYKTGGNPYEPLTEAARAAIEERVREVYSLFTRAVARNRGVSVAEVRDGFGEGRVVGARQAVQLGMADRVGTLEETIERLRGVRGNGRRTSAEAAESDMARAEASAIDLRKRRLRLNSQR
ncbi:MAG: S49 family peptidase [Ammonifex sp.]|jgi:signal peptide peptidase SppA|nr:MAG: S49 family peptidase [Ammonifex sp.]